MSDCKYIYSYGIGISETVNFVQKKALVRFEMCSETLLNYVENDLALITYKG